jgi:hypothetical protein
MVAGMVMKKRKFATRLSQGMVLLIYLILPNFSHLGFTFFEFLTVRPVLVSQIEPLLPQQVIEGMQNRPALGTDAVPFYFLELSPFVFSLLIQVLLLVTFFVLVYRKWENPSSHSFSKGFALIFYAMVQFLTLGNLLPLIDAQADGSLRFGALPREAIPIAVLLTLGFLCFAVTWMLIANITPNRFEYQTALRRVRKLNLRRIPLSWDGSSSLLHSVGLALLTGISTLLILAYLFKAGLMVGEAGPVTWGEIILFPVLLVLLTLTLFGLMEYWGNLRFLFFALLCWLVPFFAALIFIGVSNALAKPAIYLASISPPGCMIFTVILAFGALEPTEYQGPVRVAVWLCLVLYTVLPVTLIVTLRQKQRAWSRDTLQPGKS